MPLFARPGSVAASRRRTPGVLASTPSYTSWVGNSRGGGQQVQNYVQINCYAASVASTGVVYCASVGRGHQ